MNKLKYYDFVYLNQAKASNKIFKNRKRLHGKNITQDMVDEKISFFIFCLTIESIFNW